VTLAVRTVSLPAGRHRVPRIDGEIDDDLFELRHVDLDRPQVAPHATRSSLNLFADQAAQQHGEIAQCVAEMQHLRPQGSGRREKHAEQLPQPASPRGLAFCLICMIVLERRIGRLVAAFSRKSLAIMIADSNVVEIVGDARRRAGPTMSHFSATG